MTENERKFLGPVSAMGTRPASSIAAIDDAIIDASNAAFLTASEEAQKLFRGSGQIEICAHSTSHQVTPVHRRVLLGGVEEFYVSVLNVYYVYTEA